MKKKKLEMNPNVMCDICEKNTSEPVDDKYGNVVCPSCQVKSNTRYFSENLEHLVGLFYDQLRELEALEPAMDERVEELVEAIPYLNKIQLLGLIQQFKGERCACVGEVFRVAIYDQVGDRFREVTNV